MGQTKWRLEEIKVGLGVMKHREKGKMESRWHYSKRGENMEGLFGSQKDENNEIYCAGSDKGFGGD